MISLRTIIILLISDKNTSPRPGSNHKRAHMVINGAIDYPRIYHALLSKKALEKGIWIKYTQLGNSNKN